MSSSIKTKVNVWAFETSVNIKTNNQANSQASIKRGKKISSTSMFLDMFLHLSSQLYLSRKVRSKLRKQDAIEIGLKSNEIHQQHRQFAQLRTSISFLVIRLVRLCFRISRCVLHNQLQHFPLILKEDKNTWAIVYAFVLYLFTSKLVVSFCHYRYLIRINQLVLMPMICNECR